MAKQALIQKEISREKNYHKRNVSVADFNIIILINTHLLCD